MSKYSKTIASRPDGTSDVYDVLRAFEVTDPAIQHAIKKLLMPGARGHKATAQDIQEAREALGRVE